MIKTARQERRKQHLRLKIKYININATLRTKGFHYKLVGAVAKLVTVTSKNIHF